MGVECLVLRVLCEGIPLFVEVGFTESVQPLGSLNLTGVLFYFTLVKVNFF